MKEFFSRARTKSLKSSILVLSLNWFKRNYPLTILLLAFFAVFITNFSPNTYLLGWDNRAQELSPLLNLKRYIFSVWQEYQGLGLLAGHAHASEIPHALFIALLSIFLPLNWVRQIFVFLMLFTGPLGVYFLVKNLVRWDKDFLNKNIPLLGALFYLFNLSTIQTFYAALEPFIIHYAVLPWLFLSALNLLAKKTKKATLFFIIVNILAIPQAQIQTVFFVYIFALCFFFFVLLLETKSIDLLKRSVKLLLITLIINSFWLLPFIYFYLANGSVAFEAKINQMSTETIFQQNKEFGTVFDVMLLKGFWFNNVDPNLKGNFTYMLGVWKEYLTPFISVIGYLLFTTAVVGFVYVKRKAPFVLPFSALFVLAFTMLATNAPPFSWIDYLLRQVPVFNEIFRFPFTKFSTLAALTYSFFFAIGVGKLYLLIEKYLKPKALVIYSIIPIFIILLILFVLPIFKGNLFYQKEKVKLPMEYTQVFDFFKNQPNGRIANLPQHTFWGWNFYNWGYGGSGFLWYGIKQPILDRAFDVWSKYDENYYWELSYALYSKNSKLFEDVLNKYQINFLLIDKNIINPSSPQALFIPETKTLISTLPSIQKKATFGKIDIYEVNLRQKTNNFVYITDKNSSVNTYNWNNFDPIYSQKPNYVSNSVKPDIFYPLRTLFSGKNEEDKEFILTKDQDYIIFSQKMPQLKNNKLSIPPLGGNDISVIFRSENNPDGSFLINAVLETPLIYTDKQKVWGKQISKPLFLISKGGPKQFNLAFRDINLFVDLDKGQKNLGSTYVSPGDLTVSLTTSYDSFQTDLSNEFYSIQNQPHEAVLPKDKIHDFEVRIPKIEDESLSFRNTLSKNLEKKVKNCENLRRGKITSNLEDSLLSLNSKNSTACISFYSPSLAHDQGYAVFVENQNITGRSMHFWILNEDQKIAVLDTYLPRNKKASATNFVIPAYEKFGQGYSFNFESISISDETKNRLGKVFVYPIPYDFLTSLKFGAPNSNSNIERVPKVEHPNESLYIVQAENVNPDSILALSQSYDPRWYAYEVKNDNFLTQAFPFLFGKRLNEHYMINNWENGWTLNNGTIEQPASPSQGGSNNHIIIVYLPQYLEYLGFVILVISTIYLIRSRSLS